MEIEQALEPLFARVKASVFDELPEDLIYHNIDHTKRVMANAMALGVRAKLIESDLRILYAAAILHDTGYGKKYNANEGVAAILASKLLPEFGFSQEEIDQINSMILATNLIIAPSNALEIYLIDADMAYLGQDDFLDWSNKLRQEWESHGNFKGTDEEWINGQIDFLSKYSYFSQEAIALFEEGKQNNLKKLKALRTWPY